MKLTYNMSRYLAVICVVIVLSPMAVGRPSDITQEIRAKTFNPSTLLWYDTPATKWVDALPVGNGRIGAMVFGKTDIERIQLNDDTYWTGSPYSEVRHGGYQYLHELQSLVFQEKWLRAQKLFGRKFLGYPPVQQKYQPLGVLVLNFHRGPNCKGYDRWLNLDTGMVGVKFAINGVTYRRQVFASKPDQVIVVRLTANKPHSISFTAQLRGVRSQAMGGYQDNIIRMDGENGGKLTLHGRSASFMGIAGKVKFDAVVKAVPEGGQMKVVRDNLIIKGADAVTLYYVDATNFVNYHDLSANPQLKVARYLKGISGKTFAQIKQAHINAYRALFDRVSLHLPVTNYSYLPTDERLKQAEEAPDPSLSALAYQFGRYVLMSSSQPGTQPANLQGIWNNSPTPWWGSKYTTNINLEMNYWPVNSANLEELEEPLTNFMEGISRKGTVVAKQQYGAPGWVFHQNADIWRSAASMDGATWGEFTTGGAWLMNELWKHYLYTMDQSYLKKIYPMLKGSVVFFMDFLVKQPDSKWYVTNPSTSPENFPARPGNGPFFDEVTGGVRPGTNISAGSAIDMEIIHQLFGHFVEASKILHKDEAFASRVADRRKLLLPPQVGKDGALQEWADDWGQMFPHHRHMSPLWGLFPGNEFSVAKTPKLIDPIKAVLNQRGDLGPEWSRAWKVSLWARLRDGNRAIHILRSYYSHNVHAQLFAGRKTVLQIDGTMGVTAGITQMLIQSQDRKIVLLPALPRQWKSAGAFNGVMAEGAFKVNLRWKAGKVTTASILSKHGGPCRVEAQGPVHVTSNGKPVQVRHFPDGSFSFTTKKGATYVVTGE